MSAGQILGHVYAFTLKVNKYSMQINTRYNLIASYAFCDSFDTIIVSHFVGIFHKFVREIQYFGRCCGRIQSL